MKWIKFSEKKPKENKLLITRCIPWDKKGDAFESWRIWSNDILRTIPSITHWWNGEFNFDLAIKAWKDGTSTTSRTTEPSTTEKLWKK